MAPEFGTPVHQLPLIPANVLKQHRVHEPLDTQFRSAAACSRRFGARTGTCPSAAMSGEDGKRRKLGSRISEAAGKGGGN
jgi:hypothetical protein